MAGYGTRHRYATSSGMISIHTMLWKSQLKWAGHVVRMPDLGGQKKQYKDTLKASLKHCCIDFADWENVTVHCCAKLVEVLPISKKSE
jgi:hypothetical protein